MSVLELGTEAGSVAQLERELAQLRHRAGAPSPESGTPTARACVLNLVVYATRRAHAERAARTIALLSDRHPSRAIVLLHDVAGRERLPPDVSLRAHLAPAAHDRLCYEQIVVAARADSAHRLRSIVIPLLVPDLPVFVWWTGTPALDAPHFRDLVALADRLVVDSADFVRPEATFPGLSARGHADRSLGLTDLAWTRLTAWRELLAQFFDVPAWRPYLDAVSGMRIGFAVDMDGRAIHPSQALLLLGWFAARLSWRAEERLAPSEAGGHLFRMRRADGVPLWVRLRPRFARGVEEGHVTGVRVLADLEGHHAEFVIKRTEDGAAHTATEVLVDGASVLRRTVLLPMPSVIELLGEELSITGSDAVYEDALQTLVALT